MNEHAGSSSLSLNNPQDLITYYHRANAVFSSLLKQQRPTGSFQTKVIMLIHECPLFLPPYLDALEYLEEHGEHRAYDDFKHYAYQRLQSLWASPDYFDKILAGLDFATLHAIKHFLVRLQTDLHEGGEPIQKALQGVNHQLQCSTLPTTQWHLLPYRKGKEPVEQFKQELKDKEHFWYAYTRRQRDISHHAHTQMIILRALMNRDPTPKSLMGPHESQPTELAPYFPHTLDYVERIAREFHCGLGRVVLIRLHPGHMAYRHYDSEQHLIGRDRYHFVIHAKPKNYLYSADEVLLAEEGQLIRYDNTVHHKSYNESNEWRVHLVFDMFPVVEHSDGSFSPRSDS